MLLLSCHYFDFSLRRLRLRGTVFPSQRDRYIGSLRVRGTCPYDSLFGISVSADCEVDAGIYEVGLHDLGFFLTFSADYRRNCSGKAVKNVKLL